VRTAPDQLHNGNWERGATVAGASWDIEQISQEMTARVLQAHEEERGRIARELHDETAQSLVRLLIDLDLLKLHIPHDGPAGTGLRRLEQGLTRTLAEVRALAHDLRPPILEDFGLVAAIEAYSDDWTQTFGVPTQFAAQHQPDERLPIDMEIALFRFAQEAMMNAGKYAGAQEVFVSLAFADDMVRLVVQDDGIGFDPAERRGPSRRGGLGLYGMRERAAMLGGSVTIVSAVGRGTRLTLQVPVP
jgi:signal transduction histidine kinase